MSATFKNQQRPEHSDSAIRLSPSARDGNEGLAPSSAPISRTVRTRYLILTANAPKFHSHYPDECQHNLSRYHSILLSSVCVTIMWCDISVYLLRTLVTSSWSTDARRLSPDFPIRSCHVCAETDPHVPLSSHDRPLVPSLPRSQSLPLPICHEQERESLLFPLPGSFFLHHPCDPSERVDWHESPMIPLKRESSKIRRSRIYLN